MLFYKVLILFWGCTRTCSHARWFENLIIFPHNLHYYNTSLPSLTQTARLVLGLMKARPPKCFMCSNCLAVPVRCDWQTA